MHLTRFGIRNVRSIRELDVRLDVADGSPARSFVLLGPNGCGKTSIVRALASALGGLDPLLGAPELTGKDIADAAQGEPAFVDLDALVRPDDSTSEKIVLHWPVGADKSFSNLIGSAALIGGPASIALADGSERNFLGAPPATFDSRLAHVEREIRGDASRAPFVFLSARRGVLRSFPRARSDEFRASPRVDALSTKASRFTHLTTHLALAQHCPDRFDRDGWFARMREVLESKEFFPNLPKLEASDRLTPFFVAGGRRGLDVDMLSDGQRALFLIFAELARRAPENGIVLIDEVEQHLHPRWQRVILAALRAFLPSTQFIVATHSPLVAGSVPEEMKKVLGDWEGE